VSAIPDPSLVRQASRVQLPSAEEMKAGAKTAGRKGIETLGHYDDLDDWVIGPSLPFVTKGLEKLTEPYLFRRVGEVIEWTPGVHHVWRNIPKIGKVLGGVVRGVPVLGIAATWANVAVELSKGESDGIDTAIVIGSAIIETALDFTPLAPAAGLIGNGLTALARFVRSDLQKGKDSLLIQGMKNNREHGLH